MFRIILGDFDFPTLYTNAGNLGAMYFISYIFFVFFVLLNMFLAIINDSYSEVKSDPNESKNEFELGAYFKTGYENILTKMNINQDKIKDIKSVLAVETNGDQSVDFEKWRKSLKVT